MGNKLNLYATSRWADFERVWKLQLRCLRHQIHSYEQTCIANDLLCWEYSAQFFEFIFRMRDSFVQE